MTSRRGTQEEAFLEHVKSARLSSAVLKTRLITLKSDLPNVVVLAMEGEDDKIIYGQWIRRIRPGLRYEPFLCEGKKEARELKNALGRDLGHLGENVFFLIDRDFDDLHGFNDSEGVFVTDTYSVENYLVSEEVLDELLRDEFPCHAKLALRSQIVQLFSTDYNTFLRLTADVNRRLFMARRVRISLASRLPTTLRQLAAVQVGDVRAVAIRPEELVVYERQLTADETVGLAEAFGQLEPKLRYRGKFAIKFFRAWLDNLADKYTAGDKDIFGEIKPEGVVRRAEFVLSNFASKARIPTGLPDFVNAIT